MFGTIGVLYGACKGGNILEENKETGEMEVPKFTQAMLSDAVATCVGAACGTSTVTTYVESSSGIAAGGRTGLTSIVTAALFAIAMFFEPVAVLIPSCAYSAALIYVGLVMMDCIREIDWKDHLAALPAFMTVIAMPFTYNIAYGIGFGVLTYICIILFTKKRKEKEISAGLAVVGIMFLVMFLLTN